MEELRKYEVAFTAPNGEKLLEVIEVQHCWVEEGGVLSFGVDHAGGDHRSRIFAPGTWSHVRLVE